VRGAFSIASRAASGDQRLDGGFDVLGRNAIERDVEGLLADGEQRVFHARFRYSNQIATHHQNACASMR
jgi:hypothetical protein